MIKVFYCDSFNIPLPPGHRFPGGKYAALRERLLADGIVDESALHISPLASLSDVAAVHSSAYVGAVVNGGLTDGEQRRIGLPWSAHLVTRSLATTGGAISAAQSALSNGFAAQLAGGTHHAHRDFGSGYCVFNDLAAVAIKALSDGWAKRVAIIDLDVHQGDGNAAILSHRDDVLILDLYCEKNFPFRKVAPHLPVPLAAGMGDTDYLAVLRAALPAVLAFAPDLVLYQAGVDPLRHDALGHLNLSYEGLMARDRMVFEACKAAGVPLSLAIGGGYSQPIEHSVRAYANTFSVAKSVYAF